MLKRKIVTQVLLHMDKRIRVLDFALYIVMHPYEISIGGKIDYLIKCFGWNCEYVAKQLSISELFKYNIHIIKDIIIKFIVVLV